MTDSVQVSDLPLSRSNRKSTRAATSAGLGELRRHLPHLDSGPGMVVRTQAMHGESAGVWDAGVCVCVGGGVVRRVKRCGGKHAKNCDGHATHLHAGPA